MRYKLFDSFIRQDSESVDILLKDLTRSFKSMINLSKSDIKIKRGFLDDGKVFIYAYYKLQKLFSCKFSIDDMSVNILYTSYINRYEIDTSAFDDALDIIEKYVVDNRKFGASDLYYIPLNDVQKIIDEFNTNILAKRYNL